MPAITFVYWNYQDSSGIKVNSSWYFWQYRPLGQIHLLNALGQEKSKPLEAAHIAEQKALPCPSLARKLSKDSDAVPEALSCQLCLCQGDLEFLGFSCGSFLLLCIQTVG